MPQTLDRPVRQKTVYRLLKAKCLPLVEAYHGDLLIHDKRWLDRYPGVPFLHWTRETGTDLQGLLPADHHDWPAPGQRVPYLFGTADREHILSQARSIAEYHARIGSLPSRLVLYHDGFGTRLREIDVRTAVEIAAHHERTVREAWRRRTA